MSKPSDLKSQKDIMVEPQPGCETPSTTTESGKIAADRTTLHGQNDLFRELAFLWLAVNLIDAAPRRVRRALKSQEEGVIRAIERFGFRIPILVRSKPGGERYEVIDGHMRLAAAQRLGADQVPCILVDDLPDVEIRRLALSLNKLQETGAWDDDALRMEISEIIEIGETIEIPGFAMPEIEAIQFAPAEGAEADPADDISAEMSDTESTAVTRRDDVWILGHHVIVCGTARNGDALTAALEGASVDAIFTDPPYNVRIKGHVRGARSGFDEFAEASGEMSREDFVAFLVDTSGAATAKLKPGGVLFACMDWRHVGEMTEALEALELELLNICVWVKTQPGMGSLYRSQHELVFVARRSGAGHRNNVQLGKHGRNRSNVWTYAGATGGRADADDDFTLHPTVKPIRMVMDALLDVTGPGDLVFDPFLGSGTTLLACERTRRRCFGVEIEPAYVDLAIRRWQEMTGGKATHAESGVPFDEIASVQLGERGVAGTRTDANQETVQRAKTPDTEDF
ncbi:ParB/RepB/Spo0J family partition protein [Salinihabitans flavidus]|uniref:site-specific DNA-methyltransferase (adenine-specific) n=1 Tax=Salinihabitans flavidus TaxID=569882 RepID=A0A1H8TEX9_9RHOB|nr:DNA modification methylase [Salinihabitans flavidus]SEO89048.1 ParB/RepB/Spo0J family partition protein [Salinihabitans flavidus]